MAILRPDTTTTLNGVKINEYLLTKHNPNRIDMPSVSMEGKVIGITVHNTEWISVASGTTPAEQYTRATVNGNMKDVRVHYYSVRSEPLSRRFSKITITYLASAFRYVLNESAIDTGVTSEDGVIAESTADVVSKYPISEEECEPKMYIQTQGGALAETLYAEISADHGEIFRAENLAPDTVYCIDSELMTFYKCGIITNGEFSALKFVDMTGKTSGDFPILKAQRSHSISYKGYIKRMWVNLNRRFNV